MLREKYPRFMQLEEFVIPEEHLDYTIDFSNAMDSAPYLANMTMSMPAVYSLFRNMGMRHIVVVNLGKKKIVLFYFVWKNLGVFFLFRLCKLFTNKNCSHFSANKIVHK